MAGFMEVDVNRQLEFKNSAAHIPNVKGVIMPKLKIYDETFMNDSLGDWDEQEAHGATITHSAVDGGAMIITGSDTATDDCAELSHTAQWSAASNCGMEAKVKISQITDIALAIGFVDAKEATNDHIAGELVTTPTLRDPTVTADFCGFIFDTDADTDVWYIGAIDNDVIGTPVAAAGAIAPVINTYFRVRVQTNTAGDVSFFYNGKLVGVLATAIGETSAELLTPYVGTIQRVKGAQVVTMSRITTWQDCS